MVISEIFRYRSLGSGSVQKGCFGGKKMKHFTTEDWIDFANQVVSGSKKLEMANHLETGCKRCQKAASLWQRVRRTAESVSQFEVPEPAVRIAKAAFAGANIGQKRRSTSSVEVLFDSFLQPLLEGARSAASSGTRQMLYRADPIRLTCTSRPSPAQTASW